jgi:hypothetical protein
MDALGTITDFRGIMLDESIIHIDLDLGFIEERQFRYGPTGSQVRNHYCENHSQDGVGIKVVSKGCWKVLGQCD